MKTFSVKNFEKFQHYKDRAPPWIKLYNELLENYEFGRLPDAQKGQLISIWLLASRTDNRLPFDPSWIGSKINANAPVDLNALVDAGFIEDGDTDHAAHVEQSATPAQRRAKSNGFGSRHISDEVKRAVWARDGGRCQECGSNQSIEYDHKHPVSKGGTSDADNIQLLCRPCNRRKRVRVATPAQPLRSLEGEREQRESKAEPRSPSAPKTSEDFENLKKVYPRRKGNYGWKAAERKFNSLVKTGVNPKAIIAAARRLGETLSAKVGTEFIPMPASWLNSEDFIDLAVTSFDQPSSQVDWDSICDTYKKFGIWSKHAPGNSPETESCLCPPEILAKHGILVPTLRRMDA